MKPSFETNYVRLIITLTFLGLCCLLLNIAFTGGEAFAQESKFWFQRCGSLITLLAALFEYQLHKMKTQSYFLKTASEDINKWPEAIGIFMLVIGTVIWGFGDLFYASLYELTNFIWE